MVQQRNINKESKNLTDISYMQKFDSELMGIFMCDIFAPKDKSNLITFSPIASRNPDKKQLDYINKSQKNRILNTGHFKALILTGYTITLIPHKFNIQFIHTGKIFDEFIKIIGHEKTQAKETNKSLSKLWKLFLTSCAGKLAQKPMDTIQEYHSYSHEHFKESNEKMKQSNWSRSNHYIATFILSYANFILYYSMYCISLDYIYNANPLSNRCGSLLYMDTDSIVFDPALVNQLYYMFNISEEIGYYDDKKCNFYVTWKRKYENKVNMFIVIAKKSYLLYWFNENGILSCIEIKLKGIHREAMSVGRNYNVIKAILDNQPEKIKFTGLTKISNIYQGEGSAETDVIKSIKEAIITKTLARNNTYNKINCTNNLVYLKNKDNIEKTIFKNNIFNFLEFCCSDY